MEKCCKLQLEIFHLIYLISGPAICVHADGDSVLHLRNHRNATVRESRDGPVNIHRETQQLQTHLPEPPLPLQVSRD